MKCPYCGDNDTKVLDSRESTQSNTRRRRECNACNKRFTTYESVELGLTKIKKRNGKIVDFDQSKITEAIFKAAKAVGGENRKLAELLTEKIVEKLKENYNDENVPDVEMVQDVVEKILIENGNAKTAKCYILYRDQHKKIRDTRKTFLEVADTMGEYLQRSDWRVNENSNVDFSLGGLILYSSGKMTASYWLNHVYPPEVSDSHVNGDLHIHDLSMFCGYCAGWSLKQLLVEGFGGVSGQIRTKPAKHMDTVIGQVVNFLGTLQNEWAGAQAFSSFDTYLAPFVKVDNMSYKEVKQCMQNYMFHSATPSRWGTQCVTQDTDALTDKGWKKHNEIKKTDKIATFNIKTKKIEYLKPERVKAYDFDGNLINLKNRSQDQLVTPDHKVVRKVFNTNRFELIEAEKLLKFKTPIQIPVAGITKSKKEINLNLVKIIAWLVSEGTFSEDRGRVSIFQSVKHKEHCEEIRKTLRNLKFKWDETLRTSGFSKIKTIRFRLNQESSRKVRKTINEKQIPDFIKTLSSKQIKLFLETYIKGDGHREQKGRIRIYTKDKKVRDSIQELCSLTGYGSSINKRSNGVYQINIIRNQVVSITKITKKYYKGKVWCPTTKNGTFIARRNGKVFITGNTPFLNLTFDWVVPEDMKDQKAIVGGKEQDFTYGDCQKEMDLINKAFIETMIEGDAAGRVFTFPIPTYNITKDFDWNSENANLLFEMTAKYGIPYFQNFINSDLKPSDVRSMCCRLQMDLRELRNKTGGLFGSGESTGCYDKKTEVLTKNGWKLFKGVSMKDKFLTFDTKTRKISYQEPQKIFNYDYNDGMIEISGKMIDLLVTPNHNMLIETRGDSGSKPKIKFARADSLNQHDRIPRESEWEGKDIDEFILPSIEIIKYGAQGKTPYKVVREGLRIKMEAWARFIGYYLSEGSVDNEKIAKSHGYRTTISQSKKTNKKIYKNIKKNLEQLPFVYAENQKGFVICNKQLWTYLKQFGKCNEKFVPKELKELSKKYLKAFFNTYLEGDGNIHKYGGTKYIWTTSKKIVDDLQEIAVKLGNTANYQEIKKKKPGYIGKRAIMSKRKCYILSFPRAKHVYLDNRFLKFSRKKYKGKVYCVEVPNHTLLVRRNGKIVWCGNSIGVVTVNVPRLGYISNSKEEFFQKLEKVMNIASESLEIKRKAVTKSMDNGLLPYTKRYLGNLDHHFSTIGLVGMNEACTNLLDKNIATEEGKKFAVETLEFMRNKLKQYQEETGHLYNLEATPAEGTSYRLARIDKKKFPEIKTAGKEEAFYTNSTQLPVDHTEDIFDALDFQDELQTKYTGGTVFHGFLGEQVNSIEACKQLVKNVANSYKMPYFTVTPTFSVCAEHGYLKGKQETCPTCGNETEVYSRVVGYIRPVKSWNKGKKEEFAQRMTFSMPELTVQNAN